jgi:hypothetical protein
MSTPTTALNPAAIVALQFEQEMYEMLRRAGVSEARIDAMRYCEPCGGQWSRDIAADDFDLANNRSL